MADMTIINTGIKARYMGTSVEIKTPTTSAACDILAEIAQKTKSERIYTAITDVLLAATNSYGWIVYEDKAFAVDGYGNVEFSTSIAGYLERITPPAQEATPEPIDEELTPADMADLEEIMSQPTLGPYTTEELTQLLTQETTPEHEGFTLCADGQTLVPSDKHFAGCECEACETKKWEQAEREQLARYNAMPAKLLTQDELEDMAELERIAEQEYQEQLAVQANLIAFFEAAYQYCYTQVSDYLPQPHEWIYGSHNRPISAVWARIPEAHYVQLNHKGNEWIYTLVVVPEQLDSKTTDSYELELVRVPEAVLQAWNELIAVPAYTERYMQGSVDDRTVAELKQDIDIMRAEIAAKLVQV